ncbi:hypothetical protein [Streptacidiphilus albus]|uniref:hypothetical protein n=1 Tax=Streptacidiphilus albus TaxID=105425 RepID=UPI00054BC7C7|nr:hypothetical protein [Streptacidiphilus albus]
MAVLAVTGHLHLTGPTVALVRTALLELLRARAAEGSLTGISCIAKGADSLFAEAVLAVGGELVAVVPSEDYRASTVGPDHAEVFDGLVAEASGVIVMPFDHAGSEAYAAANALLLERADELVAVWDGVPSTVRGGTGDMVEHARAAGMTVVRVWPDGAARC